MPGAGLFDNVYPPELARVAATHAASKLPREAAAAKAARELARTAQAYGKDSRYFSPFAYSAVQVGARVPLPCGVRGVAALLELLGDGRHADIHAVELGDTVLVIDVHVDGQPAGHER